MNKPAHDVLRQNEETFRLMVEGVMDYSIFMLDPEGYITTWNAGAEKMKGYKAEEIIGEHFSIFYPKDEVLNGKPSRILLIATKTGKYEEEGWRIRKDGIAFWAHVLVTAIRDSEGTLKGFAKVTRDITQRRKIEERLQESEEKFRLMVESVQDYAIIMLDPKGYVTTWNAGAEKMKGYKESEILGKHCSVFYSDEDQENKKYEQEFKMALQDGRYEEEGWRRRKDGTFFWANVVITALWDQQGNIRGFSKVTRDIRSRVEELWRRVIISAPNALLMISPERDIVLANAQAEKLFQYTHKELLRKKIENLIPGKILEQKFTELSPGAGQDLFAIRKDGIKVPVEIGLNPIEMPDGKFVLVALVDLTERKHVEQKLASMNEELERKVKERTALAEQRSAKLREVAAMLTKTEQKERRRLAQILHDHLQQMLVASKISMNRLQEQVKEKFLKEKVANVERMLEESIEASRKLTAELSPPVLRDVGLLPALEWLARWMKEKHELEVKIKAEGDILNPSEDRKIFLFQAVRELLFNVVKHSGTHQAFIHMYSQDNGMCLVIEDRGKGFDVETLFSDVSYHYGLFNIRERLDMLGCEMKVESEIGKGSKFTIFSPVEEPVISHFDFEPVQALELPSPKLEEFHQIRVLVVDDHKILRQGLIHALSVHEGIEIIGEAEDGQDAVEKAAKLNPDIIIMDVTMPGLNGIEATRRIKQTHPGIKIIALSLHEAEDMAATMIAAGASIYLNKSGPIDDLIRSIRQLVPETHH